jgi:hypothetical protein
MSLVLPIDLVRQIELVRFELSVADRRVRLDRLLLAGLIWEYVDRDNFEKWTAHRDHVWEYWETYRAAQRIEVLFTVPFRIRAGFRRAPFRSDQCGTLLMTYAATRTEDPVLHEELVATLLRYAVVAGLLDGSVA